MSMKMQKHSDLDSELWSGLGDPFGLAWRLGCIASAMIVVVSWLSLTGLAVAGMVDIALWHFILVPVVAWLILLALPVLLKSRRGTLTILDAIVKTAEAWLARAGYSVDLNNDGQIGHYQPVIQPPIVEERRAIPYRVNGEAKLLAHQVQAAGGVTEAQEEETPPPSPIIRSLWTLPNGSKIEQATLEDFSDRLSLVGWDRGQWVKPGGLEREQYDGIMILMEQAGIVEGRKKGAKGKLIIKRADQRRQILNLPLIGQPRQSH